MFLALELEDGSTIYEELETKDLDEAIAIAQAALEDAPTVYILQGFEDERYGYQPATHLDALYKTEKE